MEHFNNHLNPLNTALLICDMQEKFRNKIEFFSQITKVTRRLFDTAEALGMTIVASEQNPTVFGQTVAELPVRRSKLPVFKKTRFSMYSMDLSSILTFQIIKSVVLCGIEAHVCVLQTALDLIEKGYNVYVVADATSSRSLPDRFFAYKQMERAGAILTTSECVILRLLQDTSHPMFYKLKKIFAQPAPDTGLINYF